MLTALGAVWLSVREQHPYKGPTAAGLLVMYGICVVILGYAVAQKTCNGPASRTSAALTHRGRHALDTYTDTLRGLLNGL